MSDHKSSSTVVQRSRRSSWSVRGQSVLVDTGDGVREGGSGDSSRCSFGMCCASLRPF